MLDAPTYEMDAPPMTPDISPHDEINRLKEQLRAQQETIDKLNQRITETEGERDQALELAGRDPLTELLNRREGEVRAKELLAQAQRGEIKLAYVRLDIDHFKELNDQQGHLWGDQVLIDIADKLRETKRSTDVAFRYGGEEIDLILPMDRDVHMQDLGVSVNRYLDAIHTLYRQKLEPGEEPENKTPLTASFGVAIVRPGQELSLKTVQEAADISLYRSKQAGRDQITVIHADELFLPEDQRIFWRPPRTGEHFDIMA